MTFEDLRALVAVALAVFLIVLRLDAQRLGAAEYDELDEEGRRPRFLPRLAWYLTGLALVALVDVVHPDAERVLLLGPGLDRGVALAWGLAFALAGVAQAVLLAFLRFRRLRLPGAREYPGAILNAVGTALVDEAAFRGVILGLLVAVGVRPDLAVAGQAVVYVLATRVGAPGRPFHVVVLTLVIGLVAGWVTVQTGGIGAAILGHATTRLAVFATTGHTGMLLAPVGREVEELAEARLPPPGWRVVDEEPMGLDRGGGAAADRDD
jgi:hypothetical protein